MSGYQALYAALNELGARSWVKLLPGQIRRAFAGQAQGTLATWQQLLTQLPIVTPSQRLLTTDTVQVGVADDLTTEQQAEIIAILEQFHPWRKGPFNLFGTQIDTEWRSDWKWQRLASHISPLDKRVVLDVGCGNGYHAWRMLGAGAKLVVGIDPLPLNVLQFQVVKKLHGSAPVYVLPVGLEALPLGLKCFGTVFSMGVLYHRRSPLEHLLELRECLQPGGELVLETLIIDGKQGEVLVPEGRYASMRNVWFIPSVATLLGWLRRCGFNNSRVVDITQTTTAEQRSTAWMRFHSLPDFLDPANSNLTCEGLPAPKRAIVIAQR